MTTYYLSVNRGQFHVQDVAAASSAPSADIYLQMSLTNNITRNDVVQALRLFEAYLLSNGIPNIPSAGSPGSDLPPKLSAND